MGCHGASRLAMTGMDGITTFQTFAAMPQTLVIASEAWQSRNRYELPRRYVPRNTACSVFPEKFPAAIISGERRFSGAFSRNRQYRKFLPESRIGMAAFLQLN
ncbi:MAG: hypothetical protein LBP58_09175 [Azoarcus sp.]|jgi:hypothetical protein|nr:hypothetical protein [Azoarcus sp.]